jgi:hypothetical protein
LWLWRAIGIDLERLRVLGPAQHADQPPYGVIVDGRALARPPHETDNRKAFGGVAVQQHLLVVLGMRLRVGIGQPIVSGHEFGQQAAALVENAGFVGMLVEQRRRR